MTEDKKQVSPQSLFGSYVDDSHKRTYVIDIPSKGARIYTTSHTMFTTLFVTEQLRRAEAVKTEGKSASYDIVPFKGLHVATNREAYKNMSNNYDYKTAVLYKSTPVGAENPEHQTLILSNDPQYQVDNIPYVVSGHCCTYNLHPDRGLAESKIPTLSAEGCLDVGVETPSYVADDRISMLQMSEVFTFNMQNAVNKGVAVEDTIDPYITAKQAGVAAMQAINNPPTFEE